MSRKRNTLNRAIQDLNCSEDRLLITDWKCNSLDLLNMKIYKESIIMDGAIGLYPQYFSMNENYPFMFGERSSGKRNVRRRSS